MISFLVKSFGCLVSFSSRPSGFASLATKNLASDKLVADVGAVVFPPTHPQFMGYLLICSGLNRTLA